MVFDYSGKSNDEVCRLFAEKGQLRPDAQRALEEELVRRRITLEDVSHVQEDDARDQAAASNGRRKKSGGSIGRMIQDGRETVHWWTAYKRRTGSWPWSSIAMHFMNWVVILSGGAFLIWWASGRHLSRWQFLGLFLLVGLPYMILEQWAKNKIKAKLLRDERHSKRQAQRHTAV